MQIRETREFAQWIATLRDRRAALRITDRLLRARNEGHLGVTRSLGGGLHEMKMDYGPGYRVYYTLQGAELLLLLLGGDKGSQLRDIARARSLMKNWNEED